MNDKTNIQADEIRDLIHELSELKKQNTELSDAGFKLITAQSKLHSLLHNASDGIITFSPDGKVETFNITAQYIFGYSEAEVVTRKIPDLIPCPDWVEENVAAYIRYFIASRTSPDVPLLAKHRMGYDILLHISTGQATIEDSQLFDDSSGLFNDDSSLEPISDDVPEPKEDHQVLVCFFRDITLNKKLEKELSEHKHALDLAAGVLIRDKDFRVIDVNNKFCEILNRNRSEFIGEQYIHAKLDGIPDNESVLIQRRESLSQGNYWVGESCFLNAQNEATWFSESIVPFVNLRNEPQQYHSILIDITVAKKHEEQLKQHGDELQVQVDEQLVDIKRARDTAEEANRAKSEFLANMSHEIRTPMHAIVSFTRLGLKQFTNMPLESGSVDKLQKFLANIETSSKRLLVLLNDLLDLSKLEAGREVMEFKSHDLYLLCQQITDEYFANTQEKQLKLIVNPPSDPQIILCDKHKILQVLANLITNAIKFSAEKKSIIIDIESSEMILGKRTTDTNKTKGILLSFTDQGLGIPENELDTIFDKFIQSSKTKTGAGGTGLGLSICHEIISAHKGKIWAEHNPDGGSIFKLFLPKDPLSQIHT